MTDTMTDGRSEDVPDGIRFNTWLPLEAPPCWEVLTRSHHLQKWFGDQITHDATPGGFFRDIVRRDEGTSIVIGQISHMEEPRVIHMSWSDEGWGVETQLELRITGLAGGSLLTLTHSGWRDLAAREAPQVRRDHELAWKRHLVCLESYCEQLAAERAPAPSSGPDDGPLPGGSRSGPAGSIPGMSGAAQSACFLSL